MRVRDAYALDAAPIARLGRASWWATYPPLLGPARTRAIVETRYRPETVGGWIAEARRRPEHELLVAEDLGRVAGFLHLLPTRGWAAYVQRCYVHPDAWGSGIGTALVRELEARLAPGTEWRLDVHAGNARARRFYARCGMVEAGRKPAPFEVVMSRRVPPRAPARP